MTAEQLDQLGRTTWLFVAFAAGVGVVTMGLVQLVKDLLPLRTKWQEHWIRGVVARLLRNADPRVPAEPTAGPAVDLALNDLETLAVAGQPKALYGLPINQLAGQLNSAAQAVLDYPAKRPVLFRLLATGADPQDIDTLLDTPPQAATPGEFAPPQAQARTQAFLDARNRVAHQVQRNLDALQINMGFRWSLYLQLLAVAISLLLGLALAAAAGLGPTWQVTGVVLGVGLLGGFLASVGWDLISAFLAGRGRG